jgi:hypothetical protein
MVDTTYQRYWILVNGYRHGRQAHCLGALRLVAIAGRPDAPLAQKFLSQLESGQT